MKVWTLTTDTDDGVFTTVHATEEEATQAAFDNYDPENEYGDDMQALLDGQGICLYIEEHDLELRAAKPAQTLIRAVHRAEQADSNDDEIEAYQIVAAEACALLGIDTEALVGEAGLRCLDCIEHPGWKTSDEAHRGGVFDYCSSCLGSGVDRG